MNLINIPVNNWQKFYNITPKKAVKRSFRISVKNSYIYVENPKVASTTVKKKLQEIEAKIEGIILSENRHSSEIHNKRKSLLLSPSEIGLEKFNAMLNDDAVIKFCFVRNPYTRVLSAYLSKIIGRSNEKLTKKRMINDFCGLERDADITFKQFLYAIKDPSLLYRDTHWIPQTKQVFWGDVNYNFVGYFENFNQEFAQILRKIYPRFINEKDLFHFETNPKNRTNASSLLTKFYDSETKDLVREIYQEDFQNFNYPIELLPSNKSLELSDRIESQQAIFIDSKQDLSVYKSLGDILVKQGQFAEAIAAYQKVIDFDSGNANIYRAIGHCHNQNNNYQQAIINYQKAIALEVNQPAWVYKNLGDILAKQGQFAEAITAYQKAIDFDSENANIYRAIGHCHNQNNNYQQAIINYQKAIALEVNQPAWVYKNLGNALAKQKQIDEAISNYQKAITIKSKDALTHVGLGHLYMQNSQPDRAFDCYLNAVRLQPDTKSSYGKLGYFHGGHTELDFKQLDKAIDCYRQVINRETKYFLPYVFLGDSLTAKNELDQAINYYQKAGEKKLADKYPELIESQDSLDKVTQPNFMIIGAGKSGTSSLYEYICSHPQVISSLKKEVRFFNYKPNLHKGIDWYLSHFPPIPKEKKLITGEATPGYFGSDVQESIYNLFPNLKLIAIVRNPIKRAFSHYNHWVRNGIESRSFQEAVMSEIQKLEKVFNGISVSEFANLETVKEICRQVRQGNTKGKTGYLWEGLYVYFLQKWTSYFPQAQLLVLKSEDFYSQPKIEMAKVFTFLGLADYCLPQYNKYNAGRYSSLNKELYDRIFEFYQPHNQRLEKYLNENQNQTLKRIDNNFSTWYN